MTWSWKGQPTSRVMRGWGHRWVPCNVEEQTLKEHTQEHCVLFSKNSKPGFCDGWCKYPLSRATLPLLCILSNSQIEAYLRCFACCGLWRGRIVREQESDLCHAVQRSHPLFLSIRLSLPHSARKNKDQSAFLVYRQWNWWKKRGKKRHIFLSIVEPPIITASEPWTIGR